MVKSEITEMLKMVNSNDFHLSRVCIWKKKVGKCPNQRNYFLQGGELQEVAGHLVTSGGSNQPIDLHDQQLTPDVTQLFLDSYTWCIDYVNVK